VRREERNRWCLPAACHGLASLLSRCSRSWPLRQEREQRLTTR
jgi:hypothetical protein